MKHRILPIALAALFLTGTLHAQVPALINYQGRVAVGTTNFEGTGQFKFALVDGGHDLTQQATASAFATGAPPNAVVIINVINGGFGYFAPPAVTITDATGTGATAVATVTGGGFLGGSVTSITITNGGSGYSLNPTVTIAPPPPNILINRFWGNDGAGVVVVGPGGPVIEPTTTVSLPVTKGLYSVLLGDSTIPNMAALPAQIGNPDLRLRVWFNDGTHGFQLLSPDQRLAPAAYLADGSVNFATIADGAISGAKISANGIFGSSIANQAITANKIAAGTPTAGQVLSYTAGGLTWTSGVGAFLLNATNDAYFNGGKVGIGTDTPLTKFHLFDPASVSHRIETGGGTNSWARIELKNANGQWNVGTSRGFVGDQIYFAREGAAQVFSVQPNGDTFIAGKLTGGGDLSGTRLILKADPFATTNAAVLCADPGVINFVPFNTATSRPLSIVVRDASVRQLTITGGADLAEPFEMREEELAKGSVVVIDEEHPGRLKRSTEAYDTRVAGIISGANGVNPGIALRQEGVMEGGQNVALSGRVYVQADSTGGAIKPGDLLTTSDTPGHAMKVTDHAKAQGAVIGKAMSSLNEGTGMVLVLVTLQ